MSNRLTISRWICVATSFLTIFCLWPLTASAAIAVQDSAPLTYLAGNPPVNTNLTSSLTITTGAKIIVAVVIVKGSGAIPTSVTWNASVTLTRISSQLSAQTTMRGVAVYSANVVTTGTGNLVPSAFATGTTDSWIAGFTLNGVDTTAPVLGVAVDNQTNLANSTTTTAIAGVAAGSFAIGVMSNNSTANSTPASTFSSAQGGTGTTLNSGTTPGGGAASLLSIGSVSGLAAGSDTITDTVTAGSNLSNKQPLAVAVFAPFNGTAWLGGTSSDWGNSANWSNGVPNANSAAAVFGNAGSAGAVALTSTAETVGVLTFGATVSTTISGPNTLTVNNGASNATITTTGAHAINAPITLGTNLALSGAGSMTLGGNIGDGGAGKTISLTTGTLTLSGANTYTGATTITSGTLYDSGSTASPTSISAGAALNPGTSTTPGTIIITNAAAPLTVSGNAGMNFRLNGAAGAGGTGNDFINASAGPVVLASTNVLTITGTGSAGGTYTLITGSSVTGTPSFVNNTSPLILAQLVNTGTALQVVFSAPTIWSGLGDATSWNSGANWGGTAPTSGTGTVLSFPSVTGTNPYTANNNIGTIPFVLNAMSLNSTTNGNIITGSQLQFDGAGPSLVQAASGSFNIQNSIILNATTSILGTSLSVGGSGSVTFSGPISGSGALISNDPGAPTITLSNPAGNTYGGNTAISTGTLSISNTSGSATGSGTVSMAAGTTLVSGANTTTAVSGAVTLSGASTLTVGGVGTFGLFTSGGLVLNAASVMNFDLGAPTTAGTTYDQVAVNGNLTLAGTFNLNNISSGVTTGTYTLFTYTGTLTGSGATMTLVPPAGFGYQIQIVAGTPNVVNLVVSSGLSATWAGTTAAPSNTWSIPGNWDAMPASSTTTALTFPTLGAAYTANNTLASPFNLNVLNVTSTAANTISGSALAFGGTTPAINQNAASGTFTISSPLVLNANTLFQGTGAGTVSLGGVISGTGAINVTSASGTLPTYIITNGPNTFSGATTVSGANLTLQNTVAPFGLTSGSASPLGNNGAMVTLSNGVLTVNPATTPTNMDRNITDGGQLVMTSQAAILSTGTWAINAVNTPATFKITANGGINARFTLPPTLTASSPTNTLRLELNNNVAGSGTQGGSVDFTTASPSNIPCKVVFSGVAGAGGNASVLNNGAGSGRWDIGNGAANLATYVQAAGSPGLFFENVMQVLGNNTSKVINSDITISSGTTAIEGRDASTTYTSGVGHEVILSPGKTLTISSGAKLNVDMYFSGNQNFTGGVFQLCNTVIQSGGTLNYLRSDPLATGALFNLVARNYSMHVVAGSITGSGPASVINLNLDTQDGAQNTINAATGTGTAVTITTDNPHSYVVNDWIKIGHPNNELGTGFTFAGTIPVGSFQVTGVTTNTITFASAVAPTATFSAPKPVVEAVGAGFASPAIPFVTSTASNLICNLVVNGGLTITGTNAGTPAASTQDSSRRIANLLSTARLNGITGTGGFLAPKATGALPLTLPANTATWPNNITLQVQHSTVGAPSDIKLTSTFANHITVGATTTAPDPSAVLDGGGAAVAPSAGSVNVRGFGTITGVLHVGSGASIWPGTSTSIGTPLAANETLNGSTSSLIDLSGGGKLKIVITTNGTAVTNQVLAIANGGVLALGGTSVISLGVGTGNYGTMPIPIVTSPPGSNTITAAFNSTGSIPPGWTVAYSFNGGTPFTTFGAGNTVADTVLIVPTGSVTPVKLESFAAMADGAGAFISWNAISEFQNAGFNLYRRLLGEGTWTRINPTLIAGRITSPDAKPYAFYDWAPQGQFEYRLESVSVEGVREDCASLTGQVTVDSLNAPCAVNGDGVDSIASGIQMETSRQRFVCARRERRADDAGNCP